jgi:hypothetical protein
LGVKFGLGQIEIRDSNITIYHGAHQTIRVWWSNGTTAKLPSKPLPLDSMETLDLFFPEELAITKTRPTEEEWNKSCRQTFNLQSRFCSFLENSPKEATDLGRNGPKFR